MKTNNTTNNAQFRSSPNSIKLLFRLLLIVVTGLFISSYSFSQNKDLTLVAKENIKSTNSDGTTYLMEIKNKSDEDMLIRLSIFNKSERMNPDKTESKNNVYLEAAFLNEKGDEIEGLILLKANELFTFFVKIIVPEGTPVERWNNLRLHAAYDKFPTNSSSLTLYTYVSDINETE